MIDGPRNPALDGIRGIAIVLVMLLHAAGDYFPGGAVGVDLFFALSAFLITTIVLREFEARGDFSYARFYIRRALRLGPALLLWLCLLAAPTALVVGEGESIVTSSLATLLYIGNYAVAFGWLQVGSAYTHIWSLAIEEQFYFVWPVLLVVASRSRWLLAIVVGAFLSLSILQVAFAVGSSVTYFMPWGHLVPILGGCVIAVAAHRGQHHWVRRAGSTPLALGALVVLAITTLVVDRLGPVATALAFALCGLGGCALVAHAVSRPSVLNSALSLAPIRWLGTRSYGLYLYHRTLAILMPSVIPLTLKTAVPLVFVTSFVLAELSYRFVERPIMRAGHRRLNAQRVTDARPQA